jgi:hypothetical protein
MKFALYLLLGIISLTNALPVPSTSDSKELLEEVSPNLKHRLKSDTVKTFQIKREPNPSPHEGEGPHEGGSGGWRGTGNKKWPDHSWKE